METVDTKKHLTNQCCQIFLDTIYQNGGKYTKLSLNYVPNGCNIFQIATEYHQPLPFQSPPKSTLIGIFITKIYNLVTFSIPRPSKIYPNRFENIPSGNPVRNTAPSKNNVFPWSEVILRLRMRWNDYDLKHLKLLIYTDANFRSNSFSIAWRIGRYMYVNDK
jgi:hypothetical protein